MENEKKRCNNCKYYLEHYVKRGTAYIPIGGHCINHELNVTRRKNRFELIENCDYWKSSVSKKSERKESIQKVLRDMRKRLREIELILKDDE